MSNEIIGYIASLLIGLSLGLIGSGGSILTVPVLIYLFGVDAITAAGYSLFIVGITSTIGSIDKWQKKLINIRTALLFGLPSIITISITRAYFIPFVPDIIVENSHLTLSKSSAMMILFSMLMVVAALKMLNNKTINEHHESNNYKLIFQGSMVGIISGMIGVGGGFMIIPVLTLYANVPINIAVGTSLLIIAMNATIGFFAGVDFNSTNWMLIISILFVSIIGLYIGNYLSSKTDNDFLKKLFARFVLLIGIIIFIYELTNII
jgi:uncharacterized membrane protein YfcA